MHINKYITLYALVFLLFLLVTGNSIHYSKIMCINCYGFSPFVPSDQTSVILHPALCPRRQTFIHDINQLPCPGASGCVQPKGATHSLILVLQAQGWDTPSSASSFLVGSLNFAHISVNNPFIKLNSIGLGLSVPSVSCQTLTDTVATLFLNLISGQ